MTSVFSWQNSISLCPASFYTPRPNLPVTPGVSWLLTFAFQSPIMKIHLFWVLVLEGLIGLHKTVELQLLQHYWSGHRLVLLWYWVVCLGNEQRSCCHFWDCVQVLHFGLFCPGKNTGVGCHALLQRIFPTRGSNSCLPASPALQRDSLPTEPPGNSRQPINASVLISLKRSQGSLGFLVQEATGV